MVRERTANQFGGDVSSERREDNFRRDNADYPPGGYKAHPSRRSPPRPQAFSRAHQGEESQPSGGPGPYSSRPQFDNNHSRPDRLDRDRDRDWDRDKRDQQYYQKRERDQHDAYGQSFDNRDHQPYSSNRPGVHNNPPQKRGGSSYENSGASDYEGRHFKG